MKNLNEIITKVDFLRLSALLDALAGDNRVALALEEKLARATIVEPNEAPDDLVTMNSKIIGNLSDDQRPATRESRTMTLVYPREADIVDGRISVLAPLGAEMLGSRVGEMVMWNGVDGVTRRLLIDKVIYQPEANGNWDL
jgi:regulator of nucleoside diphosphate kinase